MLYLYGLLIWCKHLLNFICTFDLREAFNNLRAGY